MVAIGLSIGSSNKEFYILLLPVFCPAGKKLAIIVKIATAALVLAQILDSQVRRARAPVAVEDAERRLLVQLVALILPLDREVQLPEEHAADPGGVVVAAHL